MEGWIKIDVNSGREKEWEVGEKNPIHPTYGFGNTFLYKAVKKSPFSMYAFREGGGG